MKKQVRVEQCDAPGCETVYPVGGALGFHFPTVLIVSAGKKQRTLKDAYACSEAHIEPAIKYLQANQKPLGRPPVKRTASNNKKEIVDEK